MVAAATMAESSRAQRARMTARSLVLFRVLRTSAFSIMHALGTIGISQRPIIERSCSLFMQRARAGLKLMFGGPVICSPRNRILYEHPVIVLGTFAILSLFAVRTLDLPIAVWMESFPKDLRGAAIWLSGLGTGKTILLTSGAVLVLRAVLPSAVADSDRARRFDTAAVLAAFIFMSVAGAGLIALLAKNIIGRARPELIDSAGAYSFRLFSFDHEFAAFPSGHSATAGAMAMSLALVFPPLRPLVIAVGALICVSRLMLEEHWASDTLMGWAIGVSFALWIAHVFARRGLVFEYGIDGRLLTVSRRRETWSSEV